MDHKLYSAGVMANFESEFRLRSDVPHVDKPFVDTYSSDPKQASEVLRTSSMLCDNYTGEESTRRKISRVREELRTNTKRYIQSKVYDPNGWNFYHSQDERNIIETELFVLEKQIDICPETPKQPDSGITLA